MNRDKPNRIGVIGDIHAENELLRVAISFLINEKADIILSTGDITNGSGDIAACCALLHKNNIIAVSSLYDRSSLEDKPGEFDERTRDYICELSSVRGMDTTAGTLLLCHSKEEYEEMKNRKYRDVHKYDFIILGNTHQPTVKRGERPAIIRVGSLKRDETPGFMMIDFDKGYLQIFQFKRNLTIFKTGSLPIRHP